MTKLSLVQPKTGGILSSLRSTSCEFLNCYYDGWFVLIAVLNYIEERWDGL